MENEFDELEKTSETKFIPTYLKLIVWMVENEIKEEDLAIACEIFLMQRKLFSEGF